MCKKTGDCCSDFKFCEAVLQFSSKSSGDSKIENCEFSSKDKETCLQCKNNFFLYNNKCLKECPVYSLVNKQNNICIKNTSCHDKNCIKCSASGKCEKCLSGLYLHQDKCMTSCPIGNRANRIDFTCISFKAKEYSFYWIFPSKSGCSQRCGNEDNDIQFDCSCRHSCLRRGNCCDDFESQCVKEFYQEGCKLCSYCFQGNCHDCKKNSSKSKSVNNQCECDEGYSYDMEEDICIREEGKDSSVMSYVNKDLKNKQNLSQTINSIESNEDYSRAIKKDVEESIKNDPGRIKLNKNDSEEDNEKNKEMKKNDEESTRDKSGENTSDKDDSEVDEKNCPETKEIGNTIKVDQELNNTNNEEEIKKDIEDDNQNNPATRLLKNDVQEGIKYIEKNQEIKKDIEDPNKDIQEIDKTIKSDSEEVNEYNEKKQLMKKIEKKSLKDCPKILEMIEEPLANMKKYKAESNVPNIKSQEENQNSHNVDRQILINDTRNKNNLTEIKRKESNQLIEIDMHNQTSTTESFIKLNSGNFYKNQSTINRKDYNLTQNNERESINVTESYLRNNKKNWTAKNFKNLSTNQTKGLVRSLHENNMTYSNNDSKALDEDLLENYKNLIILNNQTGKDLTNSSSINFPPNIMEVKQANIDYNSSVSDLFKFLSSNKSSAFPHSNTTNVYIHGDISINFLIGNKNPKIITTNVFNNHSHNNFESKEIEQRNNSTGENIEKNYSFLDVDHTHYGMLSRNETEKEIKDKSDNNQNKNVKSSLQFIVKNLK